MDWEITVGRAYRDSTEALVAEVVCDDGGEAVLKLIVPRDADAVAHETTVLRLAAEAEWRAVQLFACRQRPRATGVD